MCGIAGILAPNNGDRHKMHPIMDRMLSRLIHRGPDNQDIWMNEAIGVILGHRRLSILDLSTHASQPMKSQCGRYVVSFNGELYNFSALKQDLIRQGTVFISSSDTEVLVEAIAHYGVEAALSAFNGMFAISIWDCKTDQLTLTRDRIGKKPLYYGYADHSFIFASELKSLTEHPGFDNRLDTSALAHFFQYNYIPAPRSIYFNFKKVLPGEIITVNLSDVLKKRPPVTRTYYRVEDNFKATANQSVHDTEIHATDQLNKLLIDSTRLRMVADVPLGVFMSGGIDSTLVAALMQSQSSRNIDGFTLSFDQPEYDDYQHAAKMAKIIGIEQHRMHVTDQDALDTVPEIPLIYDEPFSDSSQIPSVLIARLARKHITVALTGDGGDELFCGYRRYLRTLKIARLNQLMPTIVKRALHGLAGSARNAIGNKKLIDICSEHPLDLYLNRVSKFANPQLLLRADDLDLGTRANQLVRNCDLELINLMGLHDHLQYLPDDILTKVDRASMASSLELRNPILDHRVVHYASTLPTQYKVSGGHGKHLLRQVLNLYMPEKDFQIPKRGFGSPIKHWLRGALRDWAEALLDPKRIQSQGILEPSVVKELWDGFILNQKKNHTQIWSILMFQAWYEKHGR